MKFYAMSRSDICSIVDDISDPTLIISIHTHLDSEPYRLKVTKNPNIKHVEFFEFNDESSTLPVLHAMTNEDGERMAKIVKEYYDKVNQIIVHCDAGQSRSVGCIAAIKKYYTNDDMEFFKGRTPNMYCYNIVLENLYK